jgi:hypothetical protein
VILQRNPRTSGFSVMLTKILEHVGQDASVPERILGGEISKVIERPSD